MPTSSLLSGSLRSLDPAGVGRVPGALLDRLFAPHGFTAHLRHVVPPTGDPEAPGHASPDRPGGAAPSPATVADDLAGARATTVTFARSGATVDASGTLLETAEAAGLTPRFRCRRGICGTCTSTLVSGTVVDTRTGERSAEPGAVRLCVSHPEGEVTVDL